MAQSHNLSVTVLVENTVSRAGLKAEHGLSMMVETTYGTVLWDTGQSPLLIDNAYKMGVRLEKINHIALSHGHYDHTGGLCTLLSLYPGVDVHGHTELFKQRFSGNLCEDHSVRAVGSPIVKELVDEKCHSLKLNKQLSEVIPGVFLTGEIPRISNYEDTGGDFYLDIKCTKCDDIIDDQALFIETSKGIVVLLGCAHGGVINTLNHISSLTGEKTIYAVLGGMHLLRASDERLNETSRIIEHYNVQLLGLCHCTGERARNYLRSQFPDRITACETGTHIELTP